MVPSELYSPVGDVRGVTPAGKYIGAGVAEDDGLGDGLLDGAVENRPFGTSIKSATIATAATAIIPMVIIIFLFLALVCGLFLPH